MFADLFKIICIWLKLYTDIQKNVESVYLANKGQLL